MLTNDQIKSLFQFCEKHFVKYYDVQVELVDHLANAIELEIANDPKISFERALEKVHKSFGVMGFAPLVAEKGKMAEKQSRKLFLRLFMDQFKWPKILTFFLLAALMFTIFSTGPFLIDWAIQAVVIISLVIHFYMMRQLQRMTKISGKKFLIVDFSWISTFLLLPAYYLNLHHLFRVNSFLNYSSTNFSLPGISIFLSLYIITAIAICQTLSSVKNTLYKNYPEIFLAVPQ